LQYHEELEAIENGTSPLTSTFLCLRRGFMDL